MFLIRIIFLFVAAYSPCPELNVGAGEVQLHVIEVERIQRRQPSLGDS